jgi:hypothetical protein
VQLSEQSVTKLHDNGAIQTVNDDEIRRFPVSEQQFATAQEYSVWVASGASYVISLAARGPNPASVMIDRDIRVVEVTAVNNLAATTRSVHNDFVAILDAQDASHIPTAIVIEIASNGQ